MADSVRFQTRARTVDHLGREQIADCPTAISELWKNAFDAYARSATLHIFDGEPVVACLCDDGHGMSRDDFINKWLVIGTESKVAGGHTPVADRNGLPFRDRQGKKGIGRLSAAYLGHLLLLVTKRRNEDFVAALIDWRLFENPFLVLDDIRIPVTTFSDKSQLELELPDLFYILLGNVSGDGLDPVRTARLEKAWLAFSRFETDPRNAGGSSVSTREKIEQTITALALKERHLAEWEVWKDSSSCGTAMVMYEVIPELEAQLRTPKSAFDLAATETFRSTLWSFLDPLASLAKCNSIPPIKDFSTSVIGWEDSRRKGIIEGAEGFDSHKASHLEHIIDGRIDEDGVFRGQIKAFGKVYPDVEILPSEKLPTRFDSRVGAFDFFAATMEFMRGNSSHTDEEFMQLTKLFEDFSGLMVFRDGFRVMPYGRIDADYFGIEERRSQKAGREFWNHRQMLGRIAISQHENPNLRDKAGREGIIDNRASKAFRDLVINILKTSARRFFGSDSEVRKRIKPDLNKQHEERQKQAQQEKLLARKRSEFRTKLTEHAPAVSVLFDQVRILRRQAFDSAAVQSESHVVQMRTALSAMKQQRSLLRLGAAPERLAPKFRDLHSSYRERMNEIDADCREIEEELGRLLNELHLQNPAQFAQNQVDSAIRHVRARLSSWTNKIEKLFESEKDRLALHAKARLSLFVEQVGPTPQEISDGKMMISEALTLIEQKTEEHDRDNDSQFSPIISALESLKESIDLDLLSTIDSEEMGSLRSELDRLTSLAQLGITVEIIDHELANFTATIDHGLRNFPPTVVGNLAYKQVQTAFEGLSTRLKFLSPLKLSGEAKYRQIYGRDISNYVEEFFRKNLQAGEFVLQATDDFRNMMVYDQPSRLYPVFINLINNSRYWLNQSREIEHKVLLSTLGGKVLVSDNGPGIERQDLVDLFSLFFSRRKGGRGVGLYLCRANLAAGGHRISYATDKELRPLSGANFVIELRDASFI